MTHRHRRWRSLRARTRSVRYLQVASWVPSAHGTGRSASPRTLTLAAAGRPSGWHALPEPPSFRGAMVIAGSTWSTSSVNALLAGLIGIAATLLGSLTTYLFQSRTAERAQSFERDERLRYEQVNACSAFASAITELKRGLITLWFYAGRPGGGLGPRAATVAGLGRRVEPGRETGGEAGDEHRMAGLHFCFGERRVT
jgi:hypothetical protein